MKNLMATVDVSFIIVNFNGEKIIVKALDYLFNQQTKYSFEVILIDNASQDLSLKKIDKYKHKITIIANKHNVGFSAGNNQGLQIAKGKYIFLLNNDALILEKTLDKLMDTIIKDPKIGIIGPKLLNPDKTTQFTGSIFGRWMYKKNIPHPVSFISGAGMLIKKDLLLSLQGLDENFFFYNEDLDLCKQIKKKGLKIIYDPSVAIIHIGGYATKTRSEQSIIEGFKGGLYFAWKHYPKIIFLIYKTILLIYISIALPILMIIKNISPKMKTLFFAYKKIFHIIIVNKIFKE